MNIKIAILTHLLAMILPIAILFLLRYFRIRFLHQKRRKLFWRSQSLNQLKKTGVFDNNPIPPPISVIQEAEGIPNIIQALSLFRELGLFNFIDENQSVSRKQISEFLKFPERATETTLDLLLAVGAIERESGNYRLTESAKLYLIPESPLALPLPFPYLAKRSLKYIRKGEVEGAINFWVRGKAYKPEGWIIKQHTYSFPLGFALRNIEDLKNAKRILDVAGGSGAVCIALALQAPGKKFFLIELPESIQFSKQLIDQYGLSNQIQCLGMNMFTEEWPNQIDAVLFTNVLHDWDEPHCHTLLQKAFNTLRPQGKIFIQESLLNEDRSAPLWTVSWNIAMLLRTYGKQFSFPELKSLLETNGFENIHVQPLLGYYSTVIGTKP